MLREPYRGEVMAETRAHLEPDYHRFEQLLETGNTVYLTPEGTYSKDGRLGPLLTAVVRFVPFAQALYTLAISYDVFVGRRLSCLFHILPAIDRQDLVTSMCAPRPITVSQKSSRRIKTGELARLVAARGGTTFIHCRRCDH